MNDIQDILLAEGLAQIYKPYDIIINLALAFFLGILISINYKHTHRGLSYSQSFMLTLVFVTFIVSMVMMVIGNNLARAFALVGALSIIRFRTVVKDTKDTAYVFISLAAGMAAGTSSYFLAFSGISIFILISYVLNKINYGSYYKSEFILRFRREKIVDENEYINIFKKFTKKSDLLHVEPYSDSSSKLTFDIIMLKNYDPNIFASEISSVKGLSEVVLVASKSDVDY